MYIYLTTHIADGKVYCGKSVYDFSAMNYPGSGTYIRSLCKHYGISISYTCRDLLLSRGLCKKILLEEISGTDRNLLGEREIFWIAKIREEYGELCMNFANGHGGNTGPLSEEHRKRIGLSSKGRPKGLKDSKKRNVTEKFCLARRGKQKPHRKRKPFSEETVKLMQSRKDQKFLESQAKKNIPERDWMQNLAIWKENCELRKVRRTQKQFFS